MEFNSLSKFIKSMIHIMFALLSRLPLIGAFLKRWKINRNYYNEIKVLKGKHQSHSEHQSILFFTVHKAASSFIGSIMNKIVEEAGMIAVNFDGYFFEIARGHEWVGSGRTMIKVLYQPFGYFYGPFRSFNREITNIDNYKIVLVLRDPRDVIVSGYYSLYSHVTPLFEGERERRVRMNRRKKKSEQRVDEYVINKLSSSSSFLDSYCEYNKKLMGKSNVLFLKYEDMVMDFDSWLDQLLNFLDINITQQLMGEIKVSADFKVTKEDIFRHKRQVTPGDYKRKLKKETVEFLNSKCLEVLNLFKYPAES